MVFTKQLENRKRKLMEIMECEITADGKRKFNPLYRYEITENRMEGTALSLTARIRRCAEFPRASKRDFWKTACQKMCWKELKKEGESMLTLQVIACIGIITGAFLLFHIRLNDFTGNIFHRLLDAPKGIREEILEETKRRKNPISEGKSRKYRQF